MIPTCKTREPVYTSIYNSVGYLGVEYFNDIHDVTVRSTDCAKRPDWEIRNEYPDLSDNRQTRLHEFYANNVQKKNHGVH